MVQQTMTNNHDVEKLKWCWYPRGSPEAVSVCTSQALITSVWAPDPFDEIILYFMFMCPYTQTQMLLFSLTDLCWCNRLKSRWDGELKSRLCFLCIFLRVCALAPHLSMHSVGGRVLVSQLTYISWVCSSLISSGGSTFLGVAFICVYEVVHESRSWK